MCPRTLLRTTLISMAAGLGVWLLAIGAMTAIPPDTGIGEVRYVHTGTWVRHFDLESGYSIAERALQILR